MPTIEFFGLSQQETHALIELARQRLADLPFHRDIVFVLRSEQSTVIGWDGAEQPFIRILTRSAERAELIRQRLNERVDIETVLIGFYPKNASHDPAS